MMKNNGFISFLAILGLLALLLLGYGSYTMIQDQNAKNAPIPTPYIAPITVDKTNINPGEILITFKTGTSMTEANNVFSKVGITEYQTISGTMIESNTILSSITVLKATVPAGEEQTIVAKLTENPVVEKASLSYK